MAYGDDSENFNEIFGLNTTFFILLSYVSEPAEGLKIW